MSFRRIFNHRCVQVGLNYVMGRCTKTEFQCAMAYLKILQARLHKHYKRLSERN